MSTERHTLSVPLAVRVDREMAAYISLALYKNSKVQPLVQMMLDEGSFASHAADPYDEILDELGYFDLSDAADALEDGFSNRCEFSSEFYGTVVRLDDDGNPDGKPEKLDTAELLLILPRDKPSLFKAAYPSMEAFLQEVRTGLGDLVPDGFDLRSRVVSAEGDDWY